MTKEQKSKNLKEKILNFIKKSTAVGSKGPLGIGWSFWNNLPLTKDESETLLTDTSFYKFISVKSKSHFAYRAIVTSAISNYPSLSIYILSADPKNPLYPYKQNVISTGIYDYKIDPSIFKDYDHPAKTEYLKICPIEEVDRFLKDPSDKVRIEAYNRKGILSCAEEMAKDKSAKVRAVACQAVPHNHPALKLMMNDRSKWVFYSVLRKINSSEIPMMLGSRHLKEGFIKNVLNKRMNNLGES